MFPTYLATAILIFHGLFIASRVRELLVIGTLLTLLGFLTLVYQISDHFTGEGITVSALVHISYGLTGGQLGVLRFPELVLTVAAVGLGLTAWLYFSARLIRNGRRANIRLSIRVALALSAIVLAIPLHPAIDDFRRLAKDLRPTTNFLDAELDWQVGKTKNDPSSLVYIYLESFERKFTDRTYFPGLTPRLNELEKEALSIRGIYNTPFTNWTMAGMSASQCGMPIAPFIRDGNRSPFTYSPGHDCLGDLLKDSGYELSYIGGSDLHFGGKGKFFNDHGFDTILGLEFFEEKFGAGLAKSRWGAYDDAVFQEAKYEYSRLADSGTRFGLFILTTSTHPPHGFPNPSCTDPAARDDLQIMLAAIACSDEDVGSFVRWLQNQEPDDLIIIIASDHLSMAGVLQTKLGAVADRDNLFLALGKNIDPGVITRTATMLDVAPTIANLLGFDTQRIGLGRTLLHPEPTLAEEHGLHELSRSLPSWRARHGVGEPPAANLY